MAEDRRNVRGHEELVLAQADDDRRAIADGDDLVWIVGGNQHEREQSAQVDQRATHGILESVALHLAFDQVRDDLGIRLGDELVSFFLQLVLEIEVVLDDAVVDDNDAPRAVAVRVSVLFGRAAVRRPPRVADPVLAFERTAGDDLLQPRQFAGASPQLD